MNQYQQPHDQHADNNSTETEGTENSDQIAALTEQLDAAEERARTYLANWQRTQADLENYKRRAQHERREAMDLANSVLVAKLMSALDDLDRAFSRPVSERRKAAWAEGAKMSYEKLKTTLASEGLTQIEAVGQPFDPRYHEAIMRRPGDDGIVLEEAQKGYMLNDRVLRPSMVVVGSQEASDYAPDEN